MLLKVGTSQQYHKLRVDMRLPSTDTLNLTAGANGLMFVGLNLADAWVTKQLLAHGGGEANAIVSGYGSDILIKGFIALAIAVILLRLGKSKLLKVLNICMVVVVLWTGGWVLTYL